MYSRFPVAFALQLVVLPALGQPHIRPQPLLPLDHITGDPNDWVNVDYVVRQSNGRSDTANARNTILRLAQRLSSRGPWSTAFCKSAPPPSLTIAIPRCD